MKTSYVWMWLLCDHADRIIGRLTRLGYGVRSATTGNPIVKGNNYYCMALFLDPLPATVKGATDIRDALTSASKEMDIGLFGIVVHFREDGKPGSYAWGADTFALPIAVPEDAAPSGVSPILRDEEDIG